MHFTLKCSRSPSSPLGMQTKSNEKSHISKRTVRATRCRASALPQLKRGHVNLLILRQKWEEWGRALGIRIKYLNTSLPHAEREKSPHSWKKMLQRRRVRESSVQLEELSSPEQNPSHPSLRNGPCLLLSFGFRSSVVCRTTGRRERGREGGGKGNYIISLFLDAVGE